MSNKESFFKFKFNEWSRDFTSLANPLILLFIPFIVLGYSKEYWLLLIALFVNEILGSSIKLIFPKTRPNGQKYSTFLEKIDAGSFPSLHSSRITIVYLTLAFYSCSPILKALFLLIIPIVMFSRIQLKKHFLTDIFGGLILGIAIWFIKFMLS